MGLPASQYSVLDAERIERVDESTFRCYVYRFRFFALEVCPVLLVRVDEEPNGCCIRLLSCKASTQYPPPTYDPCIPRILNTDQRLGFPIFWFLQLEGSPLVEAQNDKFSGEAACLLMFVLSFGVGLKPARH
jgi:hypothetical protein